MILKIVMACKSNLLKQTNFHILLRITTNVQIIGLLLMTLHYCLLKSMVLKTKKFYCVKFNFSIELSCLLLLMPKNVSFIYIRRHYMSIIICVEYF